MDKDVEQFQAELLQSVREMKAGRAARVTTVPVSQGDGGAQGSGALAGAVCGPTGGVAADLAGLGAGPAAADRRGQDPAAGRRASPRGAARVGGSVATRLISSGS